MIKRWNKIIWIKSNRSYTHPLLTIEKYAPPQKKIWRGGVCTPFLHPLVFEVTHSNLCVLTPMWKILSPGNLKSNILKLPNFIHPLSFFLSCSFFLSLTLLIYLPIFVFLVLFIYLLMIQICIHLSFPFSNFLLRNLE